MHPSLSEIPCLLLLLYYCSACPPPRPPPQILLTLSSTPPLRFSPTPPAEELLRYHAITLYRCLTEEPKWPFSGRFQSVLVPLSMLRATRESVPEAKTSPYFTTLLYSSSCSYILYRLFPLLRVARLPALATPRVDKPANLLLICNFPLNA